MNNHDFGITRTVLFFDDWEKCYTHSTTHAPAQRQTQTHTHNHTVARTQTHAHRRAHTYTTHTHNIHIAFHVSRFSKIFRKLLFIFIFAYLNNNISFWLQSFHENYWKKYKRKLYHHYLLVIKIFHEKLKIIKYIFCFNNEWQKASFFS